jgi:hypothetical protein
VLGYSSTAAQGHRHTAHKDTAHISTQHTGTKAHMRKGTKAHNSTGTQAYRHTTFSRTAHTAHTGLQHTQHTAHSTLLTAHSKQHTAHSIQHTHKTQHTANGTGTKNLASAQQHSSTEAQQHSSTAAQQRSLTHPLLCAVVCRFLYNNQLSGTVPSSVGQLTGLQFLYCPLPPPLPTSLCMCEPCEC